MEAAGPVTSDALYLYGFVLSSIEVGGFTSIESSTDLFVVDIGDIGCVVSPVSDAEYRRPAHAYAGADNAEWLTVRAIRHHDVLHRLHSAGPVVPLKFGTLCSDVRDVRGILARFHEPVAALLTSFAGCDEWTLNICADTGALERVVQQSRPGSLGLGAEAGGLSSGASYFLMRKRQQLTAELLAAAVGQIEQRVHAAIAAVGGLIGAPCARGDQERSGPTCFSSTAILVERSTMDTLRAELEAIESQHTDAHVAIDLVGPWPPYNFTGTLDVRAAR